MSSSVTSSFLVTYRVWWVDPIFQVFMAFVGCLKSTTSQPVSNESPEKNPGDDPRLSKTIQLPLWYWGSAKEPGDDVFSDPKWGAIPQNPQNHRVAPCFWCTCVNVGDWSQQISSEHFETKHLSSNWYIPFCGFSRNIPFFSPQNLVNLFGVRCQKPPKRRPPWHRFFQVKATKA